jgi:hypothetical protein
MLNIQIILLKSENKKQYFNKVHTKLYILASDLSRKKMCIYGCTLHWGNFSHLTRTFCFFFKTNLMTIYIYTQKVFKTFV